MLTWLASLLICHFHSAHASVKTTVISKYGASGDYPGCTDRAYEKAIKDGVDVLDCPVQMSKDGIPFCLSSIDLIESTRVAQTSYSRLATSIPEVKPGSGIFTFSLTWSEIQGLTGKSNSPIFFIQISKNSCRMSYTYSTQTNHTLGIAGIFCHVLHPSHIRYALSLHMDLIGAHRTLL